MTLPSYRGDAVNGLEFTAEARAPDPRRLLRVYNARRRTLNLVRAFATGGYADLRQVHAWNQDFVRAARRGQRYESLAREIDRALSFMRACGVDPESSGPCDFYSRTRRCCWSTSGADPHGLPHRPALRRVGALAVDRRAHPPAGRRARRVRVPGSNPIGVKLGPTTTPDDALALIERLDPDDEPGRLTFITRMGAGKVRDVLPTLVEKVTATGAQVAWVCDPMHGNTFEARRAATRPAASTT